MSWVRRFANLYHRKNIDDELDEELQAHLEKQSREGARPKRQSELSEAS